MVKGITSAFDHMELCLVLNLTVGGNQALHGHQSVLATHRKG